MADERLVVTRQLWFEPSPLAPRLAPGAGLDFATSFASGPEGATVVLHGAWSLPAGVADALGGRVTNALQVVAVDALDGRVFARSAERRPHGDAGPAGAQGQLHVDLSKHLGLPPERRTYGVFLWLGERASPLRFVELHGEEPGPSIFEFAKVEGSARRPDPEVVLEVAAGKLRGTARLAPLRVTGKGPSFLTVLALGARSGRLRWSASMLPEQLWQAGEVAFDLDPASFLDRPEPLPPEPLHAVAVLRGVRSNVVALEVPR